MKTYKEYEAEKEVFFKELETITIPSKEEKNFFDSFIIDSTQPLPQFHQIEIKSAEFPTVNKLSSNKFAIMKLKEIINSKFVEAGFFVSKIEITRKFLSVITSNYFDTIQIDYTIQAAVE